MNLEQANPDTNSNSGAEESDGASATSTASESVLSRSNKRKKMSTVWKYFKKSDDKKFAKCLTCSKEYKTSGNTSNLKDHLKRFHFSTFSETGEVSDDAQAPRSNFRSVSPFFKRKIEYDNSSQKKKEFDRSLAS